MSRGAAIGTRKTFGGREYIKTDEGWRYVGKGGGKKAKEHVSKHSKTSTPDPSNNSSKQSSEASKEKKSVEDHAKEASTKDLERFMQSGRDEELKQVAKQELENRKREEGGQEDDSKNSEESPNQDSDQDYSEQESKSLPNIESEQDSETLSEKDGASKLNEKKEGFSVKDAEALTSSDEEEKADINHKFEAFGRFAAGVIKGRMKSLIAYGSGGVGKFCTNSTRIYTPEGYTTHGEVRPGDLVLNAEGVATTVLQIHPQGKQKVFKVRLNDGTTILAGLEHLWKVWDKTGYWDKDQKVRVSGGRWVIMTTEQIIEKGLRLREESISKNGNKIWPEWRFLIPYAKAAQHTEQNQLIDPYELGYILGDGCISQQNRVVITVGKEDQEYFKQSFKDYEKYESSELDFTIVGERRQQVKESLNLYDLSGKTSHDKFIPSQYLYGSVEQRLALLQGLMDSDGTVGKESGVLTYYTVSKQLAQDFWQLAKSFGMKASKRLQKRKSEILESGVSECYEINFQLPRKFNPFRNPRKLERYLEFERREDVRGQAIVEIVQVEDEECTCITVSDPESLYLTEGYTVTHNTYTVTQELQKAGKKIFDPELHDPGDDDYDYVKLTGKMTAAAVYKAMYEHNGKILLFDDCDSVLQDENAINLFKGALDTSGDGTIDWGSAKKIKGFDGEEIPQKFAFNGRAMFISNLDIEGKAGEMLQPIVSRGYGINLSMDRKATMDRIRHIATDHSTGKLTNLKFPGTPSYTHEDMEAVMAYADKHREKAADLNVRTIGTLLAIKKDADEAGVPWEEDAKYVYLRKSEEPDIYNGGIFGRQKQAIEKSLGIDSRSVEEKKIDWCEMKKASLKDVVTSEKYYRG